MLSKKKIFSIIGSIVISASLIFAGCGQQTAQQVQQVETVSITHLDGTTEVPVNPKKVVIMDFGTLDTLDTIGAIPENLSTSKATLPKYLQKYKDDENVKDIGPLKEVDLEKIQAQHPDLIIISGRQTRFYKQLSEIAPTIDLSMNSNNFEEDFDRNIEIIEKVFGHKDQLEKDKANIESRIRNISENKEYTDKKGLFILTTGNKIYAYGPGMRYGWLYSTFNLTSVMGKDDIIEQKGPAGKAISYEYILQKDPDYILVVDRDYAVNSGESAKKLLDNDIIKQTKAYKNNKITILPADVWYLTDGGLQSMNMIMDDIEDSLK